LLRAGREMMRLYEIRAPFLPISRNPPALWQPVLRKKIFPGSQLDKLENKAIVDILSFPRWDHPLLPKIEQPGLPGIVTFDCRSLIIDMKTSGVDLDTRLVMLDPQLAEYAWMARIPDVAFLWFVKHGHELRKGSRVTLLETPKNTAFYAGFELLVVALGEHNDVFLGDGAAVQAYTDTLKGIRGKAREAAEAAHLVSGVVSGKLIHVQDSAITKQRLQFAAARFTEEDMNDIGRDVAQTTVEMVRANDEAYYPKLAGIRFPNQKCNFCSMRWICLNMPEERDKNLSRKGEEWLDGKYEDGE
jgi:hypothetical protein